MAGSGKGRIAIVGGGVAGICAAFAARDHGAEVVLYEALPHLGGRVAGGIGFDTGRHLATTAYTSFLALLERIGSAGSIRWLPAAYGRQAGRRHLWWSFGPPVPSGRLGPAGALLASPLLPSLDKLPSLLALNSMLKLQASETSDERLGGDHRENFLAGSGESVRDLFGRTRWPQSMVSRFGEPICMGMFNTSAQEADAGAFINALKRVVLDKHRMAGWARGNLGDVITVPAEKALRDAGVELHLNSRVTGVSRENGGWRIKARDLDEQADLLLVTLPPNQLGLLDDVAVAADLVKAASTVAGNGITTLRGHFSDGTPLPGPLVEEDGEMAIWFAEPHPEGGLLVERVLSGLPPKPMPDFDSLNTDFLSRAKQLLGCEETIKQEFRYYPYATPRLTGLTKRPTIRQGEGLCYAGDWSATGLPATLESASRAGWLAGKIMAEEGMDK